MMSEFRKAMYNAAGEFLQKQMGFSASEDFYAARTQYGPYLLGFVDGAKWIKAREGAATEQEIKEYANQYAQKESRNFEPNETDNIAKSFEAGVCWCKTEGMNLEDDNTQSGIWKWIILALCVGLALWYFAGKLSIAP